MEREGTGDCDCDLVMELGNEVMSSPALTCSKLQREVWTQGSCDSDPPSLRALRGSGPKVQHRVDPNDRVGALALAPTA